MVLVDTSVWIDFFRDGDSAAAAELDRLLDEGHVATCGLVEAELLPGLKSRRADRTVPELDGEGEAALVRGADAAAVARPAHARAGSARSERFHLRPDLDEEPATPGIQSGSWTYRVVAESGDVPEAVDSAVA